MRKRTTKFITSTLIVGMMFPQITFANNQKQSTNTMNLATYENTKSVEKDIVISSDDQLLDKNFKIYNFHSLGIKNKNLLVKGKEVKNGYAFKIGDSTYYLTGKNKNRELKTAYREPVTSIKTYKANSVKPRAFYNAKPEYEDSQILNEAVSKFKKLNKDVTDFETQIKNAIKIVYDMNLEYGGDSSKQGDLSDGTTKCSGFTWIFSELLSNTNIKYRYVLQSPRKGAPVPYIEDEDERTSWHVYNEVYNPDIKEWVRFENTTLERKSIEDFYGNTLEEKIDNYYKTFFTSKSESLDNKQTWLIDDKDKEPSTITLYITGTYLGKELIDPTCYEVTQKYFGNSIIVNNTFLENIEK